MLQKGPLGEDRLRVCTESSKHGRMFICFVALILVSYIRHIRGTKPELTKAFPSMAAILEEMQTIRCIEHDGRRKFITPFVGDQVTICDAFGFEIPEGCRPTYNHRKSTKGRRGRLMELFVKCLHNILRHLFRTNIRNLQESLRNIYEKLRGFIRSGLSGHG